MIDPPVQHPRDLLPSMPPRPVRNDLTVVIPTLGRPILETCLFYLADGTTWPAAVIIVDQGRSPAVGEIVKRLSDAGVGAEYLPSNRRGKPAGINRGVERVGTRFVAVTDDDCFPAPGWLEGMADRLRREPTTIVTGRVEHAGDPEAPFSTVTEDQEKRFTKPHPKVHPFIGGNFGMAMDVMKRVGPFDEHPSLAQAAEDTDYGYRALRLGIPIAYDPGVVVYHYHWRDAREREIRYAEYARSMGAFYGKHLRQGDPLIFMQALRALVRSPVRWARGLVKGDREMAANGRAGTENLLPGILAGLRRREIP